MNGGEKKVVFIQKAHTMKRPVKSTIRHKGEKSIDNGYSMLQANKPHINDDNNNQHD